MLGIFSHYRDQRLKQVILRFTTIQVDQFKAGGSGLDGYFRGCSERRLPALLTIKFWATHDISALSIWHVLRA